MQTALACASHTPLLFDEALSSPDTCETVEASFAELSAFVTAFDPEVIIQFSPDHYHGFHYDLMPSFCVATAAQSCGDWNTQAGHLVVDEAYALKLLSAVRRAEIDLAVSFDMTVDHGFVQMWETMWGNFTRYPIIPIFINCIADPLPSYQRATKLGEAVGKFAASSGKRILFAASGGLSHDPVVPKIVGAQNDVRARLVGKTIASAEQQSKREAQIRAAAKNAKKGKGPCRPLNPEWDIAFLKMLADGDRRTFDRLDTDEVDRLAGSGANEVLCWVAATSALSQAGAYNVVQQDYNAIPGWIAGMAHFSALSSG